MTREEMTYEEYKAKVREFMLKGYSQEWTDESMKISEAELKEAYEENWSIEAIGTAVGMGLL